MEELYKYINKLRKDYYKNSSDENFDKLSAKMSEAISDANLRVDISMSLDIVGKYLDEILDIETLAQLILERTEGSTRKVLEDIIEDYVVEDLQEHLFDYVDNLHIIVDK